MLRKYDGEFSLLGIIMDIIVGSIFEDSSIGILSGLFAGVGSKFSE